MTPTWQDELFESGGNSSESDPRCLMQGGAWQMPIGVDDHTLTHAPPHVSWPTQDLAEYVWPPSVYQATRSSDLVPGLSQLPNDSTTSEYAIFDEIDMGVWKDMNDEPSNLEIGFNCAVPQSADSLWVRHGNIVTAQGQLTGGSPTANRTPASSLSKYTEPKAYGTSMSGNGPEPRCPICVGKPPFTGHYAQRNLSRHMEKHRQENTAGSDGIGHIPCRQPGCTSTFRRDDALLVHLRRSHPNLDIPPAKKRKP